MSFRQKVREAVAEAATNIGLHTELGKLRSQGASKEDVTEGWVLWGRRQKPIRVSIVLLTLMYRASYGRTTPFSSFIELDDKSGLPGVTHNWMYHIAKDVSRLCHKNGWAYYASCLTDAAGNPTHGALKWYVNNVDSAATMADMHAAQQACFTRKPPSLTEIFLRLLEWIILNK